MIKLITIILLIIVINLKADNTIDSLYNALSKSVNYSNKISSLHSIGKYYLKSVPDSAMKYATVMYKLSEKEGDTLNIANSYKLKGDAGIYGGNLKASEKNYLKAINYYKIINNNDLISDTKNNLGAVYQFSGQYEKAILLYKESLNKSIKDNDTLSIAKSYNNIGSLYTKMDSVDMSVKYLKKSLLYKEMLNDSVGMSKTLQNIGVIYLVAQNFVKSIEYFEKAVKIKTDINDTLSISTTLSNIGLAYKNMANYDKAINYYLRALDKAKNVGYKKQEALVCNNIASVYDDWSSLDSTNLYYKQKLIEYYTKSIKVCEKIDDNVGIINVSNNLGAYFAQEKKYDKALMYYLKALRYAKKYKFITKEVITYVNIADVYLNKNDISTAISYLNKSLEILSVNADDEAYMYVYDKLSEVYLALKRNSEAKNYSLKALDKAKILDDVIYKKSIYARLADIYAKLGNYNDAYKYHKEFTYLKDSIFNKDTKNTILQLQTLYKTKEQKQKIKLLNTKNKLSITELKAERLKLRQQRIMSVGLAIIVVLVLLFLYLLYKQIKAKNKANKMLYEKNEEINAQKNELEQQYKLIKKQNTEITDSINYARLIQDAILPDISILKQHFKDYFVLFEPKSIVSGDFYWITSYNNKIIVAAVDCTGHGVPGAFMSMLGVSFLNEIVLNNKGLNSADILNLLRKKVILSLKQKSVESNQKDGMDMSLTIIDTDNKTIDFAGAYNPLFIVTSINSEIEKQIEFDSKIIKNEKFKLLELKADRMPISISRKTESFKSSIIKYRENDKIFMFSDGYVDQFHFKTFKKYKKAKFKNIILETSELTISKQGEILKDNFVKWKGNTEQTDDILIIGIDL